ncbi:hypothetical protein ACS0TY_013918 [Phlomoides rotata]
MEMKSPPPCPGTVTVRRNPPRKARATPSSAIPFRKPPSPTSLSRNIFSTEIQQNPNNINDKLTDSSARDLSETLKVFLRIRPLTVQKHIRSIAESKNAWPKNPRVKGNSRPKTKKSSEICVLVNKDFRSVTVSTPQPLQEMKRIKSEVHEGFSHVFDSEVSQIDVYEEMVKPLVEDFLKGKSGMLAAMGPSGSGKTHTVFGCAREPGMVPLALHRIFGDNESSVTHKLSIFYLSMFEISSEKGKAERMTDLLHDGGDISMQQSVIKGLQEALVSDAQQADSLIAKGMLKRATATTNSNSQSSRSQCIINIRRDSTQSGEVDGNASSSMLTIVDLAGAEREKKTGNQGARLLESNFINNTSMVFGQCLRSLLEHQKNRNKPPLQKHYKNSLLTRYLQDYMEGKKRMALVLTVKPGVEDYLDTSLLLRQASPFTKIKFKTVDGPVNVTCNKRLNQALPQVMQHKKMKFCNSATLIDEGNTDGSPNLNMCKEVAGKVIKGCLNQSNEETHEANINEIHVLSDGFVGLRIQEKLSLQGDHGKPDVKKEREYQIMQGFSRALWTVLKQYKEKLERVEMENCNLRDRLATEERRNLDLVNEMTREKMRLVDLESRLCILQENSEKISYSSNELEKTDTSQIEDLIQSSEDTQNTKGVKDPIKVDICSKSSQVLSTSTCSSSQDLIYHEDMCVVDMPSRSKATIQSTSGSLYTSHRPEEDVVDILRYVENLELESKCVSNGSSFDTSLDYEESTKSTQHSEDKQEPAQPENSAIGPTVKACVVLDCEETAESTQHSEDLKDAKQEPAQPENSVTGPTLQTNKTCIVLDCEESAESTQHSEDLKDAKQEPAWRENSASGSTVQAFIVLDCEESAESTQHSEDLKDAKQEPAWRENSESGPTVQAFIVLDCEESAESTQHSEDLKDGKQEPAQTENSASNPNVQACIALDCEESAESTQHSEDLKDAKQEPGQPENSATGPTVQACIALDCEESAESNHHSEDLKDAIQELAQLGNGATARSETVLSSSEFPRRDNTSYHVDEEQCNNAESKLEPPVTAVPEEGLDAKNEVKFVPKVAPCSNFQHTEKPKRRLQPASSVLLKDISLLHINDENNKLKGGRGGKSGNMDDKNRTQGSLSLLNLLTRMFWKHLFIEVTRLSLHLLTDHFVA